MKIKLTLLALVAVLAVGPNLPMTALATSGTDTQAAPLRGKAWKLASQAFSQYSAGQYQASEKKTRAAIQLRPDVPRLRMLLIYALQKQGKIEAALAAVADAEKAGIQSADLAQAKQSLQTHGEQGTTASAAFREGFPIATQAFEDYNRQKYVLAEQQAEKAFRIDTSQGTWALLWIGSLESQGKLQQAIDAADTALALGAPNKNDLIARKQTLLKSMSVQPAISAYQALSENDTQTAVSLAQQAVKLAPDTHSHRLLLINTLLLNNNMPAGEAAATDALEQDKEDTAALVMRAYFRQRQSKTALADQDFDDAIAQDWLDDDQRSNIRLLAADAALVSGNYARVQQLMKSLKADDKAVAERLQQADKQAPKPTTLDAQTYPPPFQDCHDTPYGTACEMKPADAAGASSASARAYLAYGKHDYQEAIRHARIAVEQAPDSATMQRLLTITLASGNTEQQTEAVQRLNQELAATPQDPALLMQRAYLRQRQRNFGEALQDFRAARQTGKAPPTVILDEGYALAGVGDKKQAVNTLKQAIDQSDSGELTLSPEQRLNTRSAIAGLSREWGTSVSAGYRGARPAGAGLNGSPITTAGDSVFGTADVYWRPSQFLNSSKQVFEVYGRLMNTLHSGSTSTASHTISDPCTGAPIQVPASNANGVSGLPSTIGSLGVRFTPSTDYALTFGLERRFLLGSATRAGSISPAAADMRCQLSGRDPSAPGGPVIGNPRSLNYNTDKGNGGWLAYATYGFYKGTGLRLDTPNWFTMEGYVQGGYSREDLPTQFWLTDAFTQQSSSRTNGRMRRDQWFANAELRAGRSFRLDAISDKLVAFPHVVLAADYLRQNNRAQIPSLGGNVPIWGNGSSWSSGAGVGVSFRYGFREDRYNATRSYLDWTIQYRTSLGGGQADRAKGLFMNLSLWY